MRGSDGFGFCVGLRNSVLRPFSKRHRRYRERRQARGSVASAQRAGASARHNPYLQQFCQCVDSASAQLCPYADSCDSQPRGQLCAAVSAAHVYPASLRRNPPQALQQRASPEMGSFCCGRRRLSVAHVASADVADDTQHGYCQPSRDQERRASVARRPVARA